MDELLEALLRLLWWPYEAWRNARENSRVGTSPHEDGAMRFWKGLAILGTGALAAAGVAAWLLLK